MHNYIRLQETYHAQVRSISSVLTQHGESHNSLNDQIYNTILLHIYLLMNILHHLLNKHVLGPCESVGTQHEPAPIACDDKQGN